MRLPIGTGSYLWRALKTVPTVVTSRAGLVEKRLNPWLGSNVTKRFFVEDVYVQM